jgi:hypothetical protein
VAAKTLSNTKIRWETPELFATPDPLVPGDEASS